MTNGRERSADDREEALYRQLQAILASGQAFDLGEDWEAERISTAVHVLLHDDTKPNARGVSILTQIGVKRSMQFASSSDGLTPSNVIPSSLIMLDTELMRYIPLCWSEHCKVERWLDFDRWWDGDPIFEDSGLADGVGTGAKLTRKALILAVRSQDNGAHFDAEWRNDTYRTMTQGTDGGIWINYTDGTKERLRGANLCAVRQIGWELIASFSSQP